MVQSVIVIGGLALFEVISSIDNAIVNATVLKTLPEKYRRLFLVWGLLVAVVIVRGVLPFLIVWLASPEMTLGETLHLVFSQPKKMEEALHTSKPLLLLGGGVYLLYVFLGWLFLEEKKYAFLVEHFVHRQAVWFNAVAAIVMCAIIYFGVRGDNPMLALSAAVGSMAFFVTDGFRKNAEEAEERLQTQALSAWSKLLYLEVLDASFSIDGVIGAFAFTLSVPLILIGNGLGALVVREVTIRGVDLVSKFAYLKNGAMYSIGMLGALMIAESFGHHFPFWVAPMNTLVLLFVFLGLSVRELRMAKAL
ncbi:MAG: DUF475 domain-containing protein [Myxococcales bacterium]|nr:DUF475 domain-containing protein [Myxococcales bacterium]